MPKSAKDVVTDHALLRWLERVYGIEVEYMRNALFDQVKDVAASGASQWSAERSMKTVSVICSLRSVGWDIYEVA